MASLADQFRVISQRFHILNGVVEALSERAMPNCPPTEARLSIKF